MPVASNSYNNPKIAYSSSATRYLKSFHIETQTDSDSFHIPDDTDSSRLWEVTTFKTRYKYVQVVAQRFTDPSTYSAQHRKPPVTMALLQSTTSYSRVALPDMMADGAPGKSSIDGTSSGTTNNSAAIGSWTLMEHSITTIASGVWEEQVTMFALSDYIWDTASFTKRLLPAESSITNQPVPATT